MKPDSRLPALCLLLVLLTIGTIPASAGRIIVEMDPDAPAPRRIAVLAELAAAGGGAAPLRIAPMFAGHTAPGDPLSRFYVAETVEEPAAERFLAAARRAPGVRSAEPDIVLPLAGAAPNDPFFNHPSPDSLQWPLHANPAGPDLDILEAWSVTRGDTSVVLAVLDSGVDWRHPDFGPPLSPFGTIWTNWTEANGLPGVDDDQNGFIDDVRGWDFVDLTTLPGEEARLDSCGTPNRTRARPACSLEDGFVPDNDPVDYDGHGTVVAGIIGARADDGVGLAGTAPGCRVMPVRVGWRQDYVDDFGRRITGGVVAMSFCAQAIVYAADAGARVLNCSWLSDQTAALAAALDYAIIDRGVVVVDAAGNGATSETQSRNYLSRRGDCIEVAALRKVGGISAVTSLGSWVDIAAPGEQLLTLLPTTRSSLYAITTFGATSFAAPFVTGVAGLALSIDPDLTPAAVRQLIRDTAVNIDDINAFWIGKYGAGLVSAGGVAARLTGRGRHRLPRPPASSPVVLSDGRFLGHDTAGQLLSMAHDGSGADSTLLALSFGVAGMPAAFEQPGGVVRAVAFRSGHVLVTDAAGRARGGWPRPVGGPLFAGPVLADLDGDGRAEVLQAGTDSLLYAWDIDGGRVPGFPVRLTDAAVTGAACGDVDGDGDREILVVTVDGVAHLVDRGGAPAPGWPLPPIPGAGRKAPLLCDLDGDGDLEVVFTGGSRIHALDRSGATLPGWPVQLSAPPATEPAAADLDGTGRGSVLLADTAGRIHVLSGSGASRTGWPVDTGAPIHSGPIAVSLNGGAPPAILVGTGSLCLNAWDGSGNVVSGWPYLMDGPAAAPAAGGFASAGRAAIWIHGSDRMARRLPLPDAPAGAAAGYWFGAGGNPARDRALPARPAPAGPGIGDAGGVTVLVAPNPSTTGRFLFRFRMETERPGALTLFDIQGRPVRKLHSGVLAAGDTIVEWDGTDDLGRPLPSGIYTYRLAWPRGQATGRVIRIR